ncbi:YibE/F family protein [Haloimpatiens sp. FM7315]|uniref:YibE/F family protein n=1 Tax=Haloimpatiens sp. FM7315 TaxID=3298609 RepID=UPI00370CA62F
MFTQKLNNNKKFIIVSLLLSLILIFTYLSYNLIQKNNEKNLAKITSINEKISVVQGVHGKNETIKNQNIKALIIKGKYKNKSISLNNKTSYSKINDSEYKIGDKIFISLKDDLKNGTIISFKRDNYILYITLVFIFLILVIGMYKGTLSLISLFINILIFSILIKTFLESGHLIIISIISSILFVVLSITIVCGISKKSLASIVSTLISTLISVIIFLIVVKINSWQGIHFESMEFLTHSPIEIFIVEIIIGTLGAVMDISISISSSLKEIHDLTPEIEVKSLIKSGIDIGKDIMGTMANTLLFAYISGSIPMIILLLKNDYSIYYILNINLSLEFIRALTGSIGVVLCIPISIYISVFFIKNLRLEKLR